MLLCGKFVKVIYYVVYKCAENTLSNHFNLPLNLFQKECLLYITDTENVVLCFAEYKMYTVFVSRRYPL